MVRIRTIPHAEAQQGRRWQELGARQQRMAAFDAYARLVADAPAGAGIFEGVGEKPLDFVLGLRAALKRAGVRAEVHRIRGRDEVRAWMEE